VALLDLQLGRRLLGPALAQFLFRVAKSRLHFQQLCLQPDALLLQKIKGGNRGVRNASVRGPAHVASATSAVRVALVLLKLHDLV